MQLPTNCPREKLGRTRWGIFCSKNCYLLSAAHPVDPGPVDDSSRGEFPSTSDKVIDLLIGEGVSEPQDEITVDQKEEQIIDNKERLTLLLTEDI